MDQQEFDRLTAQSESTIKARVICDSVAPNGCRLTTMEWTYPRFIHAEIMTHRKLSRNSASSRAIPLNKMIERVLTNPVFPIHWGKNEKGMQASEELSPMMKEIAAEEWIAARGDAVMRAERLEAIGIHKQLGNRLLEPWMWITVIVSATNFENLFGLRCHPAAEPHFQNLAYKIRDAYDASTPAEIEWGQWHLPYVGNNGGDPFDLVGDAGIEFQLWPKISSGRCARVSYLTQNNRREPEEDVKLYERLAGSFPLHASPLEHPAQAVNPMIQGNSMHDPDTKKDIDWGNFDSGWLQFRKMHENENIKKRITS